MKRPEDTSEWNEFDWERSLRESDEYAHRYFKLLQRFSDLPGADELISKHLGPEGNGESCDFDCDNCERRWDCDLAMMDEWSTDWDWIEENEDEAPSDDADAPPQPGDSWFYESHPCFRGLQKLSLGWCNVYAAVLPPENRRRGLGILFHLGRSLGNLSYSIGDGIYDRPSASVAFAKRSVHHLHVAMKAIEDLTVERPHLRPLLAAMKEHFLKVREGLIDHLNKCRSLTGDSDEDIPF